MPHRWSASHKLLFLLFLLFPLAVSGKPQSADDPCLKERSAVLDEVSNYLAKGRRDEAIASLREVGRRCKDLQTALHATEIGLDFQKVADEIKLGHDDEALKLLQVTAYAEPETVGPLSAAVAEGIGARNERRWVWGRSWIYILLVLFVMSGLVYFRGVWLVHEKSRGKEKWFWFWPPYIARRQQQPVRLFSAAFLYSSVTIMISWLILYAIDKGHFTNYFASPGVFFAVFVSLATFWSLGNTLVISSRQRSEFVNFRQFYREIERILVDLRTRDKGEATEEVYVIDYSANIGQVSDPTTAKRIAETIGQFRSRDRCTTHLLVLPDDELEKIYEPLLRRQGYEGQDLSKKFEEFKGEVEAKYADIDREHLAVWRSKKIHSEHYVVSANEGLQYIVIPRENGNRNDLMGETTYDVNRIEFLRHTALDYLREAITPSYAGKEAKNLCFNVEQCNVARIDVFFADKEPEFSRFEKLDDAPDGYDLLRQAGTYMSIEIPHGRVGKSDEYAISSPTYPLAKVRLVKSRKAPFLVSPLSYAIRLRSQGTAQTEDAPEASGPGLQEDA